MFKKPLEASLGISGVASALPFTLGIVMLGLSAALFGTRVDRNGSIVGFICNELIRPVHPRFHEPASGHMVGKVGMAA